MATITIDDDVLKKLEEKAGKESRTAEEVANELLRKSLEPYKLDLEGWKWNSELLVDVADRQKLYEVLQDDEYMKKRLVRQTPALNQGVVDWLLACPEKGFFVPIDSDSTDTL